jgi:hypothetical protein
MNSPTLRSTIMRLTVAIGDPFQVSVLGTPRAAVK